MFKKNNKDHLELACPECEVLTKVKTEDGVKCTGCETSFKGMVFKRKKYLTKAAAILVVSGAVTGITLSETIEDERLGYEGEFRLMSACVNQYGGASNYKALQERVASCSCAIRNTVNDLGIDSHSNDEDEVVKAFFHRVESEINECS
jgi:hypothetical protein